MKIVEPDPSLPSHVQFDSITGYWNSILVSTDDGDEGS